MQIDASNKNTEIVILDKNNLEYIDVIWRKFRNIFSLLIWYIFLTLSFVQISTASEILSKDDSKILFNTTFLEWKRNLNKIRSSGVGNVTTVGNEWTLIVNTDAGMLKTTPTYEGDDQGKPKRIVTAVVKNAVESATMKSLSNEELKAMIAKWYKEMLPEFTVMTKIESFGPFLQIQFFIFEAGRIPIMDKVAKETSGCWQQCIPR